jgi:hypothetical protein
MGRTLDDHVARCLGCQAERARYRRLGRVLTGLVDDVEPAPRGFLQRVDVALDGGRRPAERGARLGKAAAATGAIATAAGVVALAVWRRAHHVA